MHQLGRSLKPLHICLKHFNGWPAELNSLTSFEGLYVQYLNTTHLDYNVFDRFANTLTNLDIEYSELEKVPLAICHLNKLQYLAFGRSFNIHGNGTL